MTLAYAFRPPLSALTALAALIPALALAAPPDAGTLLESLKPAPPLPSRSAGALPEEAGRPALQLDARFKISVQGIRISGAHALGEADLQPLVADAIGQELSLAELQALAERITRRYRAAGYLLARAYLPAQEIKDGQIEIAVLEGRLGKLTLDNRSRLADADVAGYLASLKENAAVEGGALERDLLLLNDLPGSEVRSTLKPGASVGLTDLDVRVGAKSRYSGGVELDNFGNRYTGSTRLGGSFTVADLVGGDTLSVRALAANGMNYGRLAYQLPVNHHGTQAGAAYSEMHYRLGGDFADLHAHGTAGIASLYLLHPFLRSRAANVNGQASYEHKRLDDRVDATATQTGKRLDVWTLGLSGDRLDGLGGGGQNFGSLAYVGGRLHLDADSAALDAGGHRTAGAYDKITFNVSRLQGLFDRLSLYANVQGQQAGKNLDSSEKMTLGGPQAVRAYPQGEAPADDAWLASLELRYAPAANWQVSLFHDAAEGRLNHRPLSADAHNHRSLSGSGLGLVYAQPGDFSVQMTIAWREGRQPTADQDRNPRAWIQFAKRF